MDVKIVIDEDTELLATAADGMLTVAKESVTLLCGSFEIKE